MDNVDNLVYNCFFCEKRGFGLWKKMVDSVEEKCGKCGKPEKEPVFLCNVLSLP